MLCRSIAEKGFSNIKKLIADAEMAEIRIEKSGMSADEVKLLFASHSNLIATCRDEGLTQHERKELLKAAIDGGAKWIDVEVEADAEYSQELVAYAKNRDCTVIISYHNYENTPDSNELENIVNQCVSAGAELIKLATMVNDEKDNARLLSLYSKDANMLVLGMGSKGTITRVAALRMGAPFTFVSADNSKETAPGQISESQMKKILSII